MLRPNGGGAAAAALSGGKKKKPNRENAYMLFSRVVREDMYQKFGGLQRFNEHFATHYQNEQVRWDHAISIRTALSPVFNFTTVSLQNNSGTYLYLLQGSFMERIQNSPLGILSKGLKRPGRTRRRRGLTISWVPR